MNRFHKILAGLLAILMFVISLGFGVSAHYCHGELATLNMFGEADPCEMMQEPNHSCCENANSSIEDQISETGCCNDVNFITVTNLDSEFSSVVTPRALLGPSLIVQLDFEPKFAGFKSFQPRYPQYRPPLIEESLPILYQTFLI